MNRKQIAVFLAMTFMLTGCSTSGQRESAVSGEESTSREQGQSVNETVTGSELFSDRDFTVDYDPDSAARITLEGNTASCTSGTVDVDGGTIAITEEGTYILSGTLDDGMIVVNTAKDEKVQLVLDGVNICSQSSAPIYIIQTDKVFITLAEGSVNSLSNGGTYEAVDDSNIDSVIFSREDVTLNGTGKLTITSPAGHGIVSKDSLTITGGTYHITTACHGLTGKDDVSIANGDLTIIAGKDGIHSENGDDASLGWVYVDSGTFHITAEGDGISAGCWLKIADGTFHISAGGGSVNGSNQSSDGWGGFMGGPGGRGGNHRPGGEGHSSDFTDDEDSTSMKGLKSAAEVEIGGGTFVIDSADDSVHSNGNITVSGGSFDISSGDDAFHADDTLTILAGTIHVTESYEGLEGLHVLVSGGDIDLVSSDDGLNAAGGTDSSGTGGRDNGMFGGGGMGMGSSDGSIVISGGNLHITASGDGIDANGSISITGGHTVVEGPTMGDTATLDYDTTAVISGGTFIGTGASAMAQTFSGSENQGVISVSTGRQAAGTEIALTDEAGNVVLSHISRLSFEVVVFSSPDIVKGESYTIAVGQASGTFAAN